MTEHSPQGPAPDTDNQRFAELIETLEFDTVVDPGIAEFDKSLLKAKTELHDAYVATHAAFIPPDVEMAVEHELDAEWPYHGDIGRVAGRVYACVDDEEETEVLARRLGLPVQTSHDDEYYFVMDNQALRSHGVNIITSAETGDTGGDVLTDVRIGYLFSLRDDEEKQPVLIAYPEDLYGHVYELPTPVAAQRVLEKKWPDETRQMYEVLEQGLRSQVPARLRTLNELFAEAAKDEEFRIVSAIYLNEHLMIDRSHPTIATVERELLLKGALDMHGQLRWVPMEVVEPVQMSLCTPGVVWHSEPGTTDGAYELYIGGEVYSEEDTNAEMVAINPDNVTRFVPTLSQRSLATRAMMGVVANALEAEDGLDEVEDGELEEQLGRLMPREVVVKDDGTPEHVRYFEILHESLAAIQEEVRAAQRVKYASPGAVMTAATALASDIAERYSLEALLASSPIVRASGTEVIMPKPRDDAAELASMWPEKDVYAFGGDGARPLDPGDHVDGVPRSIVAAARAVGESMFVVVPLLQMTAGPPESREWQTGILTTDEVYRKSYAHVPLDGTAEISIPGLDVYREFQEVLGAARASYHASPAVLECLDVLDDAIKTEDAQQFRPVEGVGLLAALPERLRTDGLSAAPAARVVAATLVEKVARLQADIYSRAQGEWAPLSGDDEVRLVEVGDVSDEEGDVVLYGILRGTGEAVKIPLSSLRSLEF